MVNEFVAGGNGTLISSAMLPTLKDYYEDLNDLYGTSANVEKAKELLMCSDKRTSDIGYEVGYKDSHYFSYIFKKTQGCSPKEFRSRGRG